MDANRLEQLSRRLGARSFALPAETFDAEPCGKVLDTVEFVEQDHTLWCWAAVAASVHQHFCDELLEQKVIAHEVMQPEGFDCINNPTSCNKERTLTEALEAVKHLDKRIGFFLTFEKLKEEIDAERPVCITVVKDFDTEKSRHFVILNGYCDGDDGQKMNFVCSELEKFEADYGEEIKPSRYGSDSKSDQWWDSYLTIKGACNESDDS